MLKSTLSNLIKSLSKNEIVAFIYSINDIDRYLVEIRQHDEHYFVTKNDDPIQYLCLEEAKYAAKKHYAKKLYLVSNNIYQNIGITEKVNDAEKFDFIPLNFNY